jgi:Fur family peroxide stress response transcriptional regulator
MAMVVDKLRKAGLRLSPQRLAILEILEGNTEHPSADEIYDQLKDRYPSLSLATVYNTLEVLAKAGELQVVRIKSDKQRYDPNPKPHGHFLCRICDSIYDTDSVPVDIQTPFTLKGYLVEEYSIYMYGICPHCKDKEGKVKE